MHNYPYILIMFFPLLIILGSFAFFCFFIGCGDEGRVCLVEIFFVMVMSILFPAAFFGGKAILIGLLVGSVVSSYIFYTKIIDSTA